MSDARQIHLKLFDSLLGGRAELRRMQEWLKRVDRCCQAVDQGINLADLLQDPANRKSLESLFGVSNLSIGLQTLVRVALAQHAMKSFTTSFPIEGARKLEFLHRAIGGWRQFDLVFSLQSGGDGEPDGLRLMNPLERADWLGLDAIPAGTLVSVYLRTTSGKRSPIQEKAALDRVVAVFDMIQSRGDLEEVEPTPAIAMKSKSKARRPQATPAIRRELSCELPVTISKLDTFIHAGNAHLISHHVSSYPGQVKMFVLRGDKVPVLMDADTIWGLEIRNGETVVYEFYGPRPTDEFLKELAQRTNKYTQMDKVANE